MLSSSLEEEVENDADNFRRGDIVIEIVGRRR